MVDSGSHRSGWRGSLLVFSVLLLVACGGEDGIDLNENNTNSTTNFPPDSNPTSAFPDQDSFSLSAESLVVARAFNRDGETTDVNVRLADNLNNPAVPDGTVVRFTTEGGNIPDTCTTVDGACTVTWESSNPRPADGRITILAWSLGAETFRDLNSNGLFDGSDPLIQDLSEPFRDDNENGLRDTSELFVDYPSGIVAGSGSSARFDTPDGLYAGPGCAKPNACSSDDAAFIFSNIVLVMGNNAGGTVKFFSDCNLDIATDLTGNTLGPGSYCAVVTDLNGNPMPDGSDISIEGNNIDASTNLGSTLSTNSTSGSRIPFNLSKDDTSDAGSVTVTVEPPAGAAVSRSIDTQD